MSLMTFSVYCRDGACPVLVSEALLRPRFRDGTTIEVSADDCTRLRTLPLDSETAHDNLCHEILRPRHDRFTTEQDTHIIEL